MNRIYVALSFLSCCVPSVLTAQPDEAPGLWARYSLGDSVVERIDEDLSFNWAEDVPDDRLQAGRFRAEWTGQLLVRQDIAHRFHVFVQGDVVVKVGGQAVVVGTRDQAGWISGDATKLEVGLRSISIRFTKTAATARLHLFWSSDAFSLEPISPQRFFLDDDKLDSWRQVDLVQRGQSVFAAARCVACHKTDATENANPSLRAPALANIAVGTSFDWLVRKIAQPHARAQQADSQVAFNMPEFGFTRAEAESIADYLWDSSLPVSTTTGKSPANPKQPADPVKQGELLFRSVGCLACHTLGKHGTSDEFGGGALDEIAAKRTRGWIETWLANPQKLNANHRMPTFKLSAAERAQLARYLTQQGDAGRHSPDHKVNPDKVIQGRKLVEAAGCAACHRLADKSLVIRKVAPFQRVQRTEMNWETSCLAKTPDRKTWRPSYPQIDRVAVRAFIESRVGQSETATPSWTGERLLKSKGCLSCHPRGLTTGIVATAGILSRHDARLRGQSEGLIPPSLTAIGDKLTDAALLESIAGEQKHVRLPWLRVRMPRFRFDERERNALADYFVAHDRIPDLPRDLAAVVPQLNENDALIAGHNLVSTKGFSCIACHKVGSYEPKNVALGTRGSDLLLMADRMRKPFYFRWTRSPIRVVPGMEMPSLKKPVPGILDERMETQLAAIWEAVRNPKFVVPTNPSVVEQFWIVDRDQPARIVRDAFAASAARGTQSVARSFAVGLNNGHGVLFDMDQAGIVDWTFGDFARQRTVGKSWYWDMAGVPVTKNFERSQFWASLAVNSPPDATPKPATGVALQDYEPVGHAVSVNYRVDFAQGSAAAHELIQPWKSESGDRSGWERVVTIRWKSGNGAIAIRVPRSTPVLGDPQLQISEWKRGNWTSVLHNVPSADAPRFLVLPFDAASKSYHVKLQFSVSLKPSHLAIKPRPEPAPTSEVVTTVPGFEGVRLPISPSVMPTAITWLKDGTMAFTSLKGHVFLARDTNGDGLEDQLTLFEEGLAAPFGIVAVGDEIIVAHKPEVIALRDTDGDGRADKRRIVAAGWGYTDNYHDWTCGIVQDSRGRLYVGLGSDYAQRDRPTSQSKWRGKVLRIDLASGVVEPVGHSFRYPVGLAINRHDEIFVTDNQGVQNTFNEINHLIEGRHYGVPMRYEPNPDAPETRAAIQVPHPMTRSVNGIAFFTRKTSPEFQDHAIGAEYDSRLLTRFSFQRVGGELQGATYYFSRPNSGV
ncbi:MAG: c-type cytochrome, partial [Planctomycetota bacterium]|nr:c-type cytochrome [Planctomycetota bacterium]